MFAWRSAAATIGSLGFSSTMILQTGSRDPGGDAGESGSPAIAGCYDAESALFCP
jgi:hypothetical protein